MFKIFYSYFITTLAILGLCHIAQLEIESATSEYTSPLEFCDEHKSFADDYKSAWLDYEEEYLDNWEA